MRGLLTAFGGLTTRGWCFLSAGSLLSGLALYGGERDVLRIGLLLFLLPVGACLLVARTRYRLACSRKLDPARLASGATATVTLRLDNVSRLLTSVLMVEDEVPPPFGARTRFVLDRIEASGRRSLSYQIRGEIRGRYQIGPLTVRLSDPFGLCELNRSFRGRDDLVVTPAVEDLPRLRRAGAAMTAEGRARTAATSGEDDAAPRVYRHGDDLRRVHWRSSARAGELMVRREETPRSSRATLVLDTRATSWFGDGPTSSFEWAVSAAATVAVALGRAGHHIRFVTDAGGEVSVPPSGAGALLDELAVVEMSDRECLAPAVARTRLGARSGTIVAVIGGANGRDAAELARARPVAATGVAIVLDLESWGAAADSAAATEAASVRGTLHRAGWVVVEARYGDSLAAIWPTAAHGSGLPGRTARGRSAGAQGPVPNGTVPNGLVPNGRVANGSVPNGRVPNGRVANGSIPAGGPVPANGNGHGARPDGRPGGGWWGRS